MYSLSVLLSVVPLHSQHSRPLTSEYFLFLFGRWPYFLFLGNYFSTLVLRTEQLDAAMAMSFVGDTTASVLSGGGGRVDLTQVCVLGFRV